MGIILSSHAKDNFIAPYMSAFTVAEITDMSTYCDQSNYWVTNFVLNTMLRVKVKNPGRQYIFNYLRRAEAAFRLHDLARNTTSEFLKGSRQSVSLYMMAIFHWETFLAQSWQAYELLRHIFDPKTKIFQQNDGSVEERLYRLYNQTKHSEGTIRARNLPKNATIPLWLANNGLRSKNTQLSYTETGDILKDLAKWAQLLQDPLTIVEKLKKDGLTTG